MSELKNIKSVIATDLEKNSPARVKSAPPSVAEQNAMLMAQSGQPGAQMMRSTNRPHGNPGPPVGKPMGDPFSNVASVDENSTEPPAMSSAASHMQNLMLPPGSAFGRDHMAMGPPMYNSNPVTGAAMPMAFATGPGYNNRLPLGNYPPSNMMSHGNVRMYPNGLAPQPYMSGYQASNVNFAPLVYNPQQQVSVPYTGAMAPAPSYQQQPYKPQESAPVKPLVEMPQRVAVKIAKRSGEIIYSSESKTAAATAAAATAAAKPDLTSLAKSSEEATPAATLPLKMPVKVAVELKPKVKPADLTDVNSSAPLKETSEKVKQPNISAPEETRAKPTPPVAAVVKDREVDTVSADLEKKLHLEAKERDKPTSVAVDAPKVAASEKPSAVNVSASPPAKAAEKPAAVAPISVKPTLIPANVPHSTHVSFLSTFKQSLLPTLSYPGGTPAPSINNGLLVYSKKFLIAMKEACQATPKELSSEAPIAGMSSSPTGGRSARSRGGSFSANSPNPAMSRSGSQSSFHGNNSGNVGSFGSRSATTGSTINGKYRSGMPMQPGSAFQQMGSNRMLLNNSGNGPNRGGHFSQGGGKRSQSNRGSNAPSPFGGHGSGEFGGRNAPSNVRPVSKFAVNLTPEETIGKEVRILLNKLTLERFESISKQIMHLNFENEKLLETCIQLIFKKATEEPNFSGMYAQLCQRMIFDLPELQPWIIKQDAEEQAPGTPTSASVVASNTKKPKKNRFRVLLLTCCQTQFEEGAKWSEKTPLVKTAEEMTQEEKNEYLEKEEKRLKEKARTLGNIKFSGELFKLGLIGRQIMLRCIEQLLRDIQNPDEEDIESLCKLLTTVGARLDDENSKTHMNKYFERISALSQNKAKLSSRIRFMCQDLMELRQTGWHTRQKNEGPKTIAEIREAVELESRIKQEKERMNRPRNSNYKYNDNNTRSADGWTIQGSAGSGRGSNSDSFNSGKSQQSQLGLRKSAASSGDSGSTVKPNYFSEDFHLGPHGSVTGSSTASKMNGESASGNKQVNPYEVLMMTNSESNSQTTSAERKSASVAEPAKKVEKDIWSLERATRRIKGSVAEYINDNDLEYSVQQIGEIQGDYNGLIVETFLNLGCDAKAPECASIARLLVHLLEKKVVDKKSLKSALELFCETINDLYIDVHSVFKHTAMFLLALVEGEHLRWSDLLSVTQLIRTEPQNQKSPEALALLGEFFAQANDKFADSNALFKSLKVSKEALDIRELWPSLEDGTSQAVQDWAAKYKISNLFSPVAPANNGAELKAAVAQMVKDPSSKLPDLPSSYTDSPQFVCDLTETILSAIVKLNPQSTYNREEYVKADNFVTKFAPVYERFIAGSPKARVNPSWAGQQKLEILFAIQHFAALNKKVEKCIENWFRMYHTAEIVNLDTIEAWKTNSTREVASKAESLKALAKFLKSMD